MEPATISKSVPGPGWCCHNYWSRFVVSANRNRPALQCSDLLSIFIYVSFLLLLNTLFSCHIIFQWDDSNHPIPRKILKVFHPHLGSSHTPFRGLRVPLVSQLHRMSHLDKPQALPALGVPSFVGKVNTAGSAAAVGQHLTLLALMKASRLDKPKRGWWSCNLYRPFRPPHAVSVTSSKTSELGLGQDSTRKDNLNLGLKTQMWEEAYEESSQRATLRVRDLASRKEGDLPVAAGPPLRLRARAKQGPLPMICIQLSCGWGMWSFPEAQAREGSWTEEWGQFLCSQAPEGGVAEADQCSSRSWQGPAPPAPA